MGAPDLLRGSSPATRGKAPVQRGPGRVDYAPAERIGFENVPRALGDELASSGILAGSVWVASADHPVTKRRASGGSHYQQLRAWWASDWRYVEFDGTRELALGEDGLLRPAGPWKASGTVHEFPQAVAGVGSIWRFEIPEPSGAQKSPRRRSEDPLDVLPGPVAGPVLGGNADAWREFGKGWATETIVASRLVECRVLLLRAKREALSRRALERADWEIETIDTPVRRTTAFSVDVASIASLERSAFRARISR